MVAKDITLRKRAEARLAASERRYRDIVETAAEGIWTIDAEGVTTFVNPKMADMLGYRPEDMIGRPVGEFVHDQDAALLAHNIERRRQGLTEQHEFRFRKRDGSALWTSLSTNPVFDDEGAYAGALAMATDISARVQADQQLRLLASSLARMNDIVIITEAEPLDEPGPRILFVNDAFEKRTGYSRDEVIGRSPRLHAGPRHRPGRTAPHPRGARSVGGRAFAGAQLHEGRHARSGSNSTSCRSPMTTAGTRTGSRSSTTSPSASCRRCETPAATAC